MKIRWGIVGCGDVVNKRVAAAIRENPDSQLIAASRRDIHKLNAFCDRFDVPRGYTDATQMIKADDIDAVYIATPVYLHAPQTIAALEAGKHVLVEKPMAMNPHECQQMLQAAEKADRRLGVAYYRRFYPAYQQMKAWLESGELGDLLSVNIVTSAALDMPPGEDGYWRVVQAEGGGGPLMDVGSHRLDLLVDLLGMPQAVGAIHTQVAARYEAENVTTLSAQFAGGTQVSLQCLFGAAVDPDQWTLVGTRGVIEASPLNEGRLVLRRPDGQLVQESPPAENFNAPLIADFVAAIQENRPPKVDGQAGLKVNQIIEQAYSSSS